MELEVNWGRDSKSFGPADTITVGRSQQCSIVLENRSVSRKHLTISFSDGLWRYVDSSSNGTFDNGKRSSSAPIITPTTLHLGAVDGPSLALDPQPLAVQRPDPKATGSADATLATPDLVETDAQPKGDSLPAPDSGSLQSSGSQSSDSEVPSPIFPAPTPDSAVLGPEPPTAPSLFDQPAVAPNSPSGASQPAPGVPSPPLPLPLPLTPPLPQNAAAAALGSPVAPPPPSPQMQPVAKAPESPMTFGGSNTPVASGPGIESQRPTHRGSETMSGETIQISDKTLRIELDGKSGAFHPNQQVTVGRAPGNTITTGNQLVSGSHCRFTHDGTSWWIEDVGSSRGTYIDGRRVVTKQKVQGAFNVSLGDDDAGELMQVITSGYHKRQENNTPLFLAGAALAAVALVGILVFALWPNTSGFEELVAASDKASQDEIAAAKAEFASQAAGANGNTPAQLQRARLATGLILVIDSKDNVIGTGTGSIVSDDGLLLTNLHVALPGTYAERTGSELFEGAVDGPFVLVGFSSTDGGTVDRFYKADHVAAHPGHDAALLKVVEGIEIGDFPAPTIEVLPEPLEFDTSSTLRGGDQIAVIGYPGLAQQFSETARVSVSINNFQSFTECRIDSVWGCQQDYPEGLLNIAGETLEGGSSGGPIIRFGNVVGIQMGVLSAVDGSGASAQDQGVPSDILLEGFPQLPRPGE